MADDRKPSRPMSIIPRNRDQHVSKLTPPAGVPLEDWDDARASKTPIGSPDFETLMFRSGVTKEHAIAASGEIAMVRKEFKDADEKLDKRMDRLEGKVDKLDEKIDGQGDRLVDALTSTLQQHQQAATVTMTAKVRVEEAQQLAKVDVETATQKDVLEERKWRRKLILKVIAIVTPFVAAAATALTLLAKRC